MISWGFIQYILSTDPRPPLLQTVLFNKPAVEDSSLQIGMPQMKSMCVRNLPKRQGRAICQ